MTTDEQIQTYIEQILQMVNDTQYKIIPCREKTTSYIKDGKEIELNKKSPYYKKPHELATTDPERIKKWWSTTPNAYVGVCTGSTNGLFVLDLDDHDDNEKDYNSWKDRMIKEHGDDWINTYTVRTPSGGYHLYYSIDDEETLTIGSGVDGEPIDFRCNCGQVIAPPTPGYTIDKDIPIKPVPDWLIEKLTKKQPNQPIQHLTKTNKNKETKKPISTGSRNETINRAGVKARTQLGLSDEELLAYLTLINDLYTDQKLMQAEINTIYQSILKKYPESVYAEKEEEDWGEIINIATNNNFPDFPKDVFPKKIDRYIKRLARHSQVSKEAPASLFIGILGGILQDKYNVIKPNGFPQNLSIWTAAALTPSNRKSSVRKSLIKPIRKWEELQEKLINKENEKIQDIREEIQGKIEELKNKNKKDKISNDEKEKNKKMIETLRDELPEKLETKWLMAEDITPEGAVLFLKENRRRMLISSDEGGIIGNILGRYNQGKDFSDIFNKGYSGDTYDKHRASGEKNDYTKRLEEVLVSISLILQPKVLNRLLSNESLQITGFNSRLLFCYPRNYRGYRSERNSPQMSKEITDEYNEIITKMLNLEPETVNGRDNITVSKDAIEKYYDFFDDNEKDFREGGIWNNDEREDIGGKYVDNILRIAACLSILEAIENNIKPKEISLENLEKAKKIGDYYKAHMISILAESDAEQTSKEIKIIEWIQKKKLQTFRRAEVQTSIRRTIKSPQELTDALRMLEDCNYIRRVKNSKRNEYEVNPQVHKLITKMTKNQINNPYPPIDDDEEEVEDKKEELEENQLSPQELDDTTANFIQNNITNQGDTDEPNTSTPPRTPQVSPDAPDDTTSLPIRDDRNDDNSVNNTKRVLTPTPPTLEDTKMENDPTNPADDFYKVFSKLECPEEDEEKEEKEDTTYTIDNLDALVEGVNF